MCSVAFQRKNTTLTIRRRCGGCYKAISTQNPRRFRRDLSSLPLNYQAMLYAAQLRCRTIDYASSAAYCKGLPLHSGLRAENKHRATRSGYSAAVGPRVSCFTCFLDALLSATLAWTRQAEPNYTSTRATLERFISDLDTLADRGRDIGTVRECLRS
jgi:hypothetical protein